MAENRFYICRKCGNVIGLIEGSGVPIKCCSQNMEQLEPERDEEKAKKHKPIVKVEDDTVKVQIGESSHPMDETHAITWVYLQTDRGGHRKCLNIGGNAQVDFVLTNEKPIAVYAYCNLHGMWMSEV